MLLALSISSCKDINTAVASANDPVEKISEVIRQADEAREKLEIKKFQQVKARLMLTQDTKLKRKYRDLKYIKNSDKIPLKPSNSEIDILAWNDALRMKSELFIRNLGGLRNQFFCHPLSQVARVKPTWNLEDWRPSISLWKTIVFGCNP